MNKLSCLLLLAAMTSPAWADCTYPKMPAKVPDGNTATREEMVAAQKVIKQYQGDMSTYLDCIKTAHHEALAKDPALTDEQKQSMTTRFMQQNDAAVDEEQQVAQRFNEQLRAFRAKGGK